MRGLKSNILHLLEQIQYSRTPRWVRGLKFFNISHAISPRLGRTPRWVRGLKLIIMIELCQAPQSHPTMGAWIEIPYAENLYPIPQGRTPRWVRGLKSLYETLCCGNGGVAPHDGCVD